MSVLLLDNADDWFHRLTNLGWCESRSHGTNFTKIPGHCWTLQRPSIYFHIWRRFRVVSIAILEFLMALLITFKIWAAKWWHCTLNDIVNLHELQHTEGLRAANRLTNSHVQFDKQKMNCWFSMHDFHSMCNHMQAYEHEDAASGHRTRCGCCYDVFCSVEDLEQHLFHGTISAYNRHHITIFNLMQISLLFNYHNL